MFFTLNSWTVEGMVEGLEEAQADLERQASNLQAEIRAIKDILSRVGNHCGVEGCVYNTWSAESMAEHKDSVHCIITV